MSSQFEQAPVPLEIQNQVGSLSNLNTTEKSNLVGAVNEVKGAIPAVVDNLTSTSTTSALSANQGKVLNSKPTVNAIQKKQYRFGYFGYSRCICL